MAFFTHLVDRFRSGHAHGVGDREGVHVAFFGDLLEPCPAASVYFGARGVDGEKDGVKSGFFRGKRGVDGGLDRAVHGPAVGVLDHVVAGGNFDDHAAAAARLHYSHFFGDAAAEGENLRTSGPGWRCLEWLPCPGRKRRAFRPRCGARPCASSCLAIATFSSRRKTTAVCCSPSRKVTS